MHEDGPGEFLEGVPEEVTMGGCRNGNRNTQLRRGKETAEEQEPPRKSSDGVSGAVYRPQLLLKKSENLDPTPKVLVNRGMLMVRYLLTSKSTMKKQSKQAAKDILWKRLTALQEEPGRSCRYPRRQCCHGMSQDVTAPCLLLPDTCQWDRCGGRDSETDPHPVEAEAKVCVCMCVSQFLTKKVKKKFFNVKLEKSL